MMSKNLIAIHKRTENRNRGYTLMEVMIAIAIFSIGFMAVGSMQIMAMRTGVSSRNQTTVLSIAKDRAEELEALPFTHADLAGSAAPGTTHAPAADVDGIDNDENGVVDDETPGTGHVTITWNVIDDQPIAGTKSIRITVNRTTGAGSQRNATLDFIKANM
jgi:prepilin-type N-terminal cleavage/methylation domain-containing protein